MNPLSSELLYHPCDTNKLGFKTTDELDDIEELIGQARALKALHFGIGIKQEGYNLYILGPAGMGKHTVVHQYLEKLSATGTTPSDWCYVNNFAFPHKPNAMELPSGQGLVFRQDMQNLIEDLRAAIPAAFEAEKYHARVQDVQDKLKEKIENAFQALSKEAEQHEIAFLHTPHGFAFAPMKKGEVVKPAEFDTLPEKEQERINEVMSVLEEKLDHLIRQQHIWERELRDSIKSLNREVAMFAAGHLFDELKNKYTEFKNVLEYLDQVQDDVIAHFYDFSRDDESQNPALGMSVDDQAPFSIYEVNVLVDNSETEGLPVIYEDSPVYNNLIGRVEHKAQMGTLVTDFHLIKPGALHRANGGYLILDAIKLLTDPYAWEGLKQAISSHEIRIQSLGDIYSSISTISLEPEPIPLDLKIVLVGDRMLYYLLHAYDPEFKELFKVAADFEERMERNDKNNQLYSRLIATIAKKNNLHPFDCDAVARIIEHGARIAEDKEKLSTHILSVADLLRESDYWANENGKTVIQRGDVQQAIDHQIHRSDRIREHLYEEIQRGTILIDTKGERVGQINGLAVMELANFSFAQPVRITATARLGEGEVIDIEREVELGGALHSKGVFILSSFLGARYAKNRPLSLSASLVFEQSYGMIEGDSASMAELCALLSVLADAPIKQNLAITGSVNQHGEAQAIGGVNEKIEGFYDICKRAGLTGDQGVIVPESNINHLMLRHDVVASAEKGDFSIYAIKNIDQAIEILTGIASGLADEKGDYPDESINKRIETRLIELAEIHTEYSKPNNQKNMDTNNTA